MAWFTPFCQLRGLLNFATKLLNFSQGSAIYAQTVCPFVLGLIGLICSCVDSKGIIQLKQAVVGRGFSHQTLCRPSSTQKQKWFHSIFNSYGGWKELLPSPSSWQAVVGCLRLWEISTFTIWESQTKTKSSNSLVRHSCAQSGCLSSSAP